MPAIYPAPPPGPFVRAEETRLVESNDAELRLRCVNLAGWIDPVLYLFGAHFQALLQGPTEFKKELEDLVGTERAARFWSAWERTFVEERDFADIRSLGFNCVRLPINYKTIVADPDLLQPPRLSESGIAPIDRAVEWGERHGVYVLLDLHVAPGGQNPAPAVADVSRWRWKAGLWTGNNTEANQEHTIALWQLLAARYAARTGVLGYDLLNEPMLPWTARADELPHFYFRIIRAIRAVDPYHLIMVEGDNAAREFGMFQAPLDSQLVYSFHAYSFLNPPWRTPRRELIEPYLLLRDSHQAPLFLGEFGEGSLEWQRAVVRLMEDHRIGWAIWPWKRIEYPNQPALLTIRTPVRWDRLFRYLMAPWFNPRPTESEAHQALDEMLAAVRSEQCILNETLVNALTGIGDMPVQGVRPDYHRSPVGDLSSQLMR